MGVVPFLFPLLSMKGGSVFIIIMVIILALMLLLLNRIILSSNIYSKIGGYRLIVLAWRYDIVLSCEVRRTPIDLIEGESELVSGFNTEFSGREFVRFFLGEYLGIIILLVMIVSSEIYIFLIFYGVVMWVRRSYPRQKYTEIVISIWRYVVLSVMLVYLV